MAQTGTGKKKKKKKFISGSHGSEYEADSLLE
jgi:hypothetical protein